MNWIYGAGQVQTAAELELARNFVSRLTGQPVNEKRCVALGRRFGTYVRFAEAGRTAVLRSLRVALRLFGDEFARKLTLRRTKRARAVPAAEPTAPTPSRAEYEEFLEFEAEERAKIERMPMVSGSTVQAVLAAFDAPGAKAQRLELFFGQNASKV